MNSSFDALHRQGDTLGIIITMWIKYYITVLILQFEFYVLKLNIFYLELDYFYQNYSELTLLRNTIPIANKTFWF